MFQNYTKGSTRVGGPEFTTKGESEDSSTLIMSTLGDTGRINNEKLKDQNVDQIFETLKSITE